MTIYRRHLRYGNFDRVRHGKNFLDFLATQAERLSGSGTGIAVSFDNTNNQVSLAGHGFESGDGEFFFENSGGALPAELDGETGYWVNVVDEDTFTLHTSQSDAVAGDNVVSFTDDGTGDSSILIPAGMREIYLALKSGKTAEQIRAADSLDNL
jgi:hypothetical protein